MAVREVIFRGKRKDNGEWVYGVPLKEGYSQEVEMLWYEYSSLAYTERVQVIPQTVGQYTGLMDKDGKKVFEGDIVKCTDRTYDYSFTAVVMFGNPNGEYNWGFQLKRISGASANTDILLWFDMDDVGACAEVVGNIHDNKELLEVK